MLNSIDYFDTAEGSFEYYSKRANSVMLINYSIDIPNQLSYNSTSCVSNHEDVAEYIFNNGNGKTIINKNKQFTEYELPKLDRESDTLKNVKPKDRYKTNKTVIDDPSEAPLTRSTLLLGPSQDSLCNQNVALGFLQNYNSWNISGEETYLGLDAVKITGQSNDYYANRFGKNFEMLVEKNTGILLKFEVFNSQDDVGTSLITREIKIDKNINLNKLNKDLTGYKNVTVKELGSNNK